ncbi:MAG: type II secretion system protein GspN [Candidatus Binatia bacterium]
MLPSRPSPSTPDEVLTAHPVNWLWGKRSRAGWSARLSSRWGWSLYTFLCFCVFLFLTFPADVVIHRVVLSATRGTPVRVRYAQGELTWLGACVVRDVTVEQSNPQVPTLNISRLSVRPSWLGLFWGRAFPMSFHADLYGGTARGTVDTAEKGLTTRVALQKIDLSQLPLGAAIRTGTVQGTIEGTGEVSGDFSELFSLQGKLALRVTQGALRAGAISGMPVPQLQSVHAALQTTLNSGRLDVTDLTLTADGIEARLRGTVVLSTPVVHSGLDLQLTTKTIGSPPPSLAALVSLLPALPNAPGERSATVRGSVAAPLMR